VRAQKQNNLGQKNKRGENMAESNGSNVSVLSGLVSIVIPCCGQLEYTKLCVPSVLRHSRAPFEMIFLDIGSLDGTAEYLAGVAAGATKVRVEVVRARTDLEIGACSKEALDLAAGEYVVLLNNDTIVTDAWLGQMIELAKRSQAVGLVGPMSNYAAPPQLVEVVPYRLGGALRGALSAERGARERVVGAARSALGAPRSATPTDALDKFAAEFRDKHRGNWVETERLGGFCLLIKRHVLDKIGSGLDDWTDLSLFDTDILSVKARQAGFTLACCRDLFVHHFGTRTFVHG